MKSKWIWTYLEIIGQEDGGNGQDDGGVSQDRVDKLKQRPEASVLARSEVGDDGLDEGDHQDGQAKQRVQLLILDWLELLVNDDGDEASDTEEDAEDHAYSVDLEPDSHAHYLLTLSTQS